MYNQYLQNFASLTMGEYFVTPRAKLFARGFFFFSYKKYAENASFS